MSCRIVQPLAAFAALIIAAGRLVGQDVSGGKYQIAPEPAWVEPLALRATEDSAANQGRDGISNLLLEEQIRVEPREVYTQLARKVLNETGVQYGSEIHLEVDPAYETLEIHKVEVLRNGAWQQRLVPHIISVLQRESDMERFMLDGRYTIVIRLGDIRPGDVIRYSYTTKGANPVMDGHFYTRFSAGSSEPCGQMRRRIWMPANRRLHVKNHNTDLKPTIQEKEDGTLYEWLATDLPVSIPEEDIPLWADAYRWVEASDMDRWSEVVDWALPLYSLDQPLTPELEEEIKRLESLDSKEAKILGALRLVQDGIRYFGTETGEHSHRPRAPAVVYGQRFGDCKEKVLLLGVILRQLGLPADAVLVNTVFGRGIEDFLPTPLAFNHVILRTSLDGREYYLDATRNHQRGPLASLRVSEFGLGLVVRQGETGLRPIKPTEESAPRSETEEIVELPSTEGTATAIFRVHTTLHGDAAETARERFASASREELQEVYKRYYSDLYPSLEVADPIRHSDDQSKNTFEVWESYRIPNVWQKESDGVRYSLSFLPREVAACLKSPATSGRKHPFSIPHPVDVKTRTVVKLPDPWPFEPENFKEKNKFFDVSYDISRDGDSTAIIASSFRSLTDHVEAGDVREYRTVSGRVQEALGFKFTFTPGTSTVPKSGSVWSLWPMFLAVVVGFAISLVAAMVFWWWAWRLPPPERVRSYRRHLDGLGGWLVLVAIGVIVRPFITLYSLAGLFVPYVENPAVFQLFTTAKGAYYSPAWLPIFIIEILVLCALTSFGFLLIAFFFGKRSVFPIMFSVLMTAYVIFGVFETLSVYLITVDKMPQLGGEVAGNISEVMKSLVAAAIWIPYMLMSRRVESTFRY